MGQVDDPQIPVRSVDEPLMEDTRTFGACEYDCDGGGGVVEVGSIRAVSNQWSAIVI